MQKKRNKIIDGMSYPIFCLETMGLGTYSLIRILQEFGDYTIGAKIGSSYVLGILFSFSKMADRNPVAGQISVWAIWVIVIGTCLLAFWVLGWILFGITSVLEGIISYIKKAMIRRPSDEM